MVGIRGRAPGVSQHAPQFLKHRIHILPRGDTLAHRDGKVAIGAAACAEGDVEIEVAHRPKLNDRPTASPCLYRMLRPRSKDDVWRVAPCDALCAHSLCGEGATTPSENIPCCGRQSSIDGRGQSRRGS